MHKPTEYLRIGTKFYRRIVKPNIYKKPISLIVPWKIRTIKEDNVSLENIDFERYDDFVNCEPDICPPNLFNLRNYIEKYEKVLGIKTKRKVYYPINEVFDNLFAKE